MSTATIMRLPIYPLSHRTPSRWDRRESADKLYVSQPDIHLFGYREQCNNAEIKKFYIMNAKTGENGKTEFIKKVEAFAHELKDTFHNNENETKGLIILCVDDHAVDDTKTTATTVVLGRGRELAPMLGEFLKENQPLATLALLYAKMAED